MSAKCPHCGCAKIEIEPARGDAICTSCGIVLSEHNIISEVQFVENSKGGSSAVGQFVSSDGINKRPNFSLSFHGIFSRESREITLSNAHKRIKALAQQLRLNSHCIETSFNFFKLGLSKGLTKGRKSALIVGACVYITCRTESTAHMLIDVSDALQTDVYELGRTYLRLSTALCITIPAMDPCLYIWRFAHKLSFGDSTHDVSETALRLVKRMKRDWMHTGRRPSGLCGAALVIAARLHNFNRTITDVIKVVKVHESTLRKRLTEFGETPSSALTTEEFMTVDLDEEQDPPAFKVAKTKEQARVQMLLEQEENLDSEFSEIQQEIEKHLEERRKKLRGIWAKYDRDDEEQDVTNKERENAYTQKFITEVTLETIGECLTDSKEKPGSEIKVNVGIGPSAASLGLTDSIEECMEIRPSDPQPTDNGVLDLTGIDDDEIDSYIMSDREIKFKTDLWMKLNEEYLEEVRLKEEQEKKEAEEREKEGKPAKKKKTYSKKSKNSGPANTAGEAIEKMLQEKKLSSKINYDVLRNLNSDNEDADFEVDEQLPATTYAKAPVETPVGIQSILHSLTGKRIRETHLDIKDNKKTKVEDVTTTKLNEKDKNEIEQEDDDDDEAEEEEEEVEDDDESVSTLQLLRQRRGESDNNFDEYDDYD